MGAVVALVLLCIGLVGKQIDHLPHCRRCGYDVSGIDPSATCPECGADLALRRAIRIGLRRKRAWALISAGTLFFFVLLPGYFAGKDIVANGVWQALPDWLIGKLAFSANARIAEDATKVLFWRDANGLLDPAVKSTVITSVVDAFEQNKSLTTSYLPFVVFEGMLDGTTTQEEANRFCVAYFVPKVELVRSGPNPALRVEFSATSQIPITFTTAAGPRTYPKSFPWAASIDATLKCPELGFDVSHQFHVSPRNLNVFVFNCDSNSQSSDPRLTLTLRGDMRFPAQTPGLQNSATQPLVAVPFRIESIQVPIMELAAPSR